MKAKKTHHLRKRQHIYVKVCLIITLTPIKINSNINQHNRNRSLFLYSLSIYFINFTFKICLYKRRWRPEISILMNVWKESGQILREAERASTAAREECGTSTSVTTKDISFLNGVSVREKDLTEYINIA